MSGLFRTRAGRRCPIAARRRAGVVILAALAFVLPVAGTAIGADGAAKPELRVGLILGPSNLDPAKDAITGPHAAMRSLTNEALLHTNPDGSVAPGLATKWRYLGAGNKDFELTLRKNARFSDGSPLNAQAVKKWLLYYAQQPNPFVALLGPIKSIETRGSSVVRLHLRTPNPIIPLLFSSAFNWGLVSGLSNPAALATRSNGVGPYVVDSSKTISGNTYTLVPNPRYYDKKRILWSKVTFKIIPNPTTMLQAVRAGELDVAMGDASTAAAVESSSVDIVHAAGGAVVISLLDRNGELAKPLADVRVRQALNYAIDRAAIVKGLFGKYGAPTSQYLFSDGDKSLDQYYRYDAPRAKALLAAAGYRDGFTLPVVTQGFLGNLGAPTTLAVAKYLDAVGVKLDITTTAAFPEWIQKGLTRGAPAAQWTPGAVPMWQTYSFTKKPGSTLNPFSAQDAVLDRLFLAQQRAQGKKATALTHEMARRWVTQALDLPVFKYDLIFYVAKDVGGVKLQDGMVGFPLASDWFPK